MDPAEEQSHRYARAMIRDNLMQFCEETNTAKPVSGLGGAQPRIFFARPPSQSQTQNTSLEANSLTHPYSKNTYASSLYSSGGAQPRIFNTRPPPQGQAQNIHSYSQSLYASTLNLMSIGGVLPHDSNTKPPQQTVADADSQPQTTSFLSRSSDQLLHGADSRADVLKKRHDHVIQDCMQSLERQERSLEEARKKLENPNIEWVKPPAMPSNPIDKQRDMAREQDFLIAESKDLAKERRQFVWSWGTTTVPTESRPLEKVSTRLANAKERERAEEIKEEPKEIIRQPGPSRLPDIEAKRDHGTRKSYRMSNSPPANSFASVHARLGSDGYPALDSYNHAEAKQRHRGPYPLGSFRRSNADIKVPQVTDPLKPEFPPSGSSDKSNDAFPLLPSPSYEYASNNCRGNSRPFQMEANYDASAFSRMQWQSISILDRAQEHSLSEQNKKLQRELREAEARGEKEINLSKGLFRGNSKVSKQLNKSQDITKSSQTPFPEFRAINQISLPILQSTKPSNKGFEVAKQPTVESCGDGVNDDLTTSPVKLHPKHTLAVEEIPQPGTSSQAIEKKQKRPERVYIGNAYVESPKAPCSPRPTKLARPMDSVAMQKSSSIKLGGTESDFADDEQEVEEVELKGEETGEEDGVRGEKAEEDEEWIVV